VPGTEFVSRDLDLWAYRRGVTLDFSRPGKPTDNAFIEAFNSKFRQECLGARHHCRSDQRRSNGNFLTLADAREKVEAWRRYYNEERPHSAIGYNAPISLVNHDGRLRHAVMPARDFQNRAVQGSGSAQTQRTPARNGPDVGENVRRRGAPRRFGR
jgi:hypothetical protein